MPSLHAAVPVLIALVLLRLYGPLVEVISLADAIGHAPGSGAAQPA